MHDTRDLVDYRPAGAGGDPAPVCAGCSWRPAPARTPEHDLDIRQLAELNLKAHPDDGVAETLVRVLGLSGVKPDPEDAPAIIARAGRGAEAERATLADWARGPGAIASAKPTPAPSGAWSFVRWLTRWAVILIAVAGVLLILGGVRGGLWLRAILARGRASWDALTAVTANVDRAKATMPPDQAKSLTKTLATVSPDVAETVREARLAAGTYSDTLP